MSEGDEAKPDDDEDMLNLNTNITDPDLLGGETNIESENFCLLAGLDTQVDNQTDLLDMQGEGLAVQDSKNLLDI